ncbi:hypothetical protein K0F93_06320 [Bacteroides ovatus]|nr:hypothetical protein [Bacteroides ovatus]
MSSYRFRYKSQRRKMKMKLDRRKVQWAVYLILLVGLVVYGLRDSEGAERLIRAITDAFAILFNNST